MRTSGCCRPRAFTWRESSRKKAKSRTRQRPSLGQVEDGDREKKATHTPPPRPLWLVRSRQPVYRRMAAGRVAPSLAVGGRAAPSGFDPARLLCYPRPAPRPPSPIPTPPRRPRCFCPTTTTKAMSGGDERRPAYPPYLRPLIFSFQSGVGSRIPRALLLMSPGPASLGILPRHAHVTWPGESSGILQL